MGDDLFVGHRSPQSGQVTASSNNVPTSFSTGAGSKILSAIGRVKTLHILNETEGRIAFNYTFGLDGATGAPASSAIQGYVPASGSVAMDVYSPTNLFIQSNTGAALTTGRVSAWVS